MATMTAGSNNPMPTTSPPQPLWQAPVFVLGVAALIAVWCCRPLWPEQFDRRVDHQLGQIRQMLTRPDGDAEGAFQQVRELLDQLEARQHDRIGEASLLAGSAQIRLAEKMDPIHAREAWQRAREYLNQAQKCTLSEEDQKILLYRVAKVAFLSGDDPSTVIPRLEESVPNCDHRAEGYALLTQAYLRLPKPDLERAVEANKKLRAVPDASESELAEAKLLGGDLLLRMGKPEEARRSLDKISEQGPPILLARARLLRARAYEEERAWGEAARLYGQVANDPKAVGFDPGQVHYHRGLCHRNLEQPLEAIKAWQQCCTESRGPEGPAAALLLAELRIAEPALDLALEALARAVEKVNAPDQWKNPYADVARVREVFDRGLTAFRQAGRYDLAMKLLDSYARMVPAKRIHVTRGEVAAEMARARAEAGKGNPEEQNRARDLFQLAGESYARGAAVPGLQVTEQGELLWASAQNFLAAGNDREAGTRFEEVLRLNLEGARLGEAWYQLGNINRKAKANDKAGNCYRECMKYDTRYAYRARYQLAMAAIEEGDIDQAVDTLILNTKMLRWESDPEALSQSLFALSNLLYQKREYRRVLPYLENALGRFKDDPEATRARYQLADSYRQLANQEQLSSYMGEGMSNEGKAHFLKEHHRWLQKAADEFATLESYLETPQAQDHLTPEQREQVPLIAAQCWFTLGSYDKSLAIWEKQITLHSKVGEPTPGAPKNGDKRETKRAERLLGALGGAVACEAQLGRIEKVRQRLLQIKMMLPEVEPDVREQWDKWLTLAMKELNTER